MTHFNKSSQAAALLGEACRFAGVDELAVIQDVATRWWSTYAMLARLLDLYRPLCSLALGDRVKITFPSPSEWAICKYGVALLEPFMIVQRTLEGEKYVSNSLVIPLISEVRDKLRKAVDGVAGEPGAPDAIKDAAQRMLTIYEEKWGDGSDICTYMEGPRRQPKGFTVNQVLATALDPRTFDLYGMPQGEHAVAWGLVRAELVARIKLDAAEGTVIAAPVGGAAAAAAAASPAALTAVPSSRFSGVVAERAAAADFKATSGFFQRSQRAASAVAPEVSESDLLRRYEAMADYELERFKRLDILPMEARNEKLLVEPTNPLKWWAGQQKQFPYLAKLARRFLCVPATSAPSERLFSVAGLTVTQHRNRLSDHAVTLLVYLRNAWPVVEDWRKKRAAKAKAA